MNGLRRNYATAEARAFWDFVDRIAAKVARWPAWKLGKAEPARSDSEPAPKNTNENHD